MEFKPGTKSAIVGGTGSGKSTVLSLIGRLYNVCSGTITFNDQNIDTLTIKSVRDQITIVSQNIVIFDQSIEDNIRYANPTATREMIFEAAKKAEIDKLLFERKGRRWSEWKPIIGRAKATNSASSRISEASTYLIIRRSNLCFRRSYRSKHRKIIEQTRRKYHYYCGGSQAKQYKRC